MYTSLNNVECSLLPLVFFETKSQAVSEVSLSPKGTSSRQGTYSQYHRLPFTSTVPLPGMTSPALHYPGATQPLPGSPPRLSESPLSNSSSHSLAAFKTLEHWQFQSCLLSERKVSSLCHPCIPPHGPGMQGAAPERPGG